MSIIPANPGVFYWQNPSPHGPRAGSFRPQGKLLLVPIDETAAHPNADFAFRTPGKKSIAARFFVGFNVGGRPRWDVDDLVPIVRRVRDKQKQPSDSSFIAQKGIYTSFETKRTVVEKGAQIIVINITGQSAKAFEKDMVELAETIAKDLKQELVILELQRGGITQWTIGVQSS